MQVPGHPLRQMPGEGFAVCNPLAFDLKEDSPLGETVVMAVTLPTGGEPFCVGLGVSKPFFWDGQSPTCIPGFSFEVVAVSEPYSFVAVTSSSYVLSPDS